MDNNNNINKNNMKERLDEIELKLVDIKTIISELIRDYGKNINDPGVRIKDCKVDDITFESQINEKIKKKSTKLFWTMK